MALIQELIRFELERVGPPEVELARTMITERTKVTTAVPRATTLMVCSLSLGNVISAEGSQQREEDDEAQAPAAIEPAPSFSPSLIFIGKPPRRPRAPGPP